MKIKTFYVQPTDEYEKNNIQYNKVLILLFRYCNFSGLAGYLAGVSVAVKQAMPDHVIYRSPVGKITNRNIPLACFLLAFVLWAIGKIVSLFST